MPSFACTCAKLRKLTRAMSRLYDQHMATVGLKTTQYSVLASASRDPLTGSATEADKRANRRASIQIGMSQ